jgi:hypothetical protein
MRPWQKAYAQARSSAQPTMKDPKKFKAFIDARYEA